MPDSKKCLFIIGLISFILGAIAVFMLNILSNKELVWKITSARRYYIYEYENENKIQRDHEDRYVYDKKGRLAKKSTWRASEYWNNPPSFDSLSEENTYEYHASGKRIEEKYCNDSGQEYMDRRCEYRFDDEGNLIQFRFGNYSGATVYEMDYDDKRRPIRLGHDNSVVIFEYDNDGKLVKRSALNDNNFEYERSEYKYNQDGNLIEESGYWATSYMYVYNSSNQMVKEMCENDHSDDYSPWSEFEYDKNGNIKSEKIHDEYGVYVNEYKYGKYPESKYDKWIRIIQDLDLEYIISGWETGEHARTGFVRAFD